MGATALGRKLADTANREAVSIRYPAPGTQRRDELAGGSSCGRFRRSRITFQLLQTFTSHRLRTLNMLFLQRFTITGSSQLKAGVVPTVGGAIQRAFRYRIRWRRANVPCSAGFPADAGPPRGQDTRSVAASCRPDMAPWTECAMAISPTMTNGPEITTSSPFSHSRSTPGRTWSGYRPSCSDRLG